jgi:hypothetical protein
MAHLDVKPNPTPKNEDFLLQRRPAFKEGDPPERFRSQPDQNKDTNSKRTPLL